jgi:hypothetical protein
MSMRRATRGVGTAGQRRRAGPQGLLVRKAHRFARRSVNRSRARRVCPVYRDRRVPARKAHRPARRTGVGWNRQGAQGPQGPSLFIVAAGAPSTISTPVGAAWWDTDNGRTFILFDDGTSKQWARDSSARKARKDRKAVKGRRLSRPQGFKRGRTGLGRTGTGGRTVCRVRGAPSTVAGPTGPQGLTGPQGPQVTLVRRVRKAHKPMPVRKVW